MMVLFSTSDLASAARCGRYPHLRRFALGRGRFGHVASLHIAARIGNAILSKSARRRLSLKPFCLAQVVSVVDPQTPGLCTRHLPLTILPLHPLPPPYRQIVPSPPPLQPFPLGFHHLNNRLQLPRIPNRILNHLPTRYQDLLLRPHILALLQREIYPPVLDDPAALVRKLHDAAFAVEEEEVFGVEDGEGGVGFFGAGGDFGADGADEDLWWRVCGVSEVPGVSSVVVWDSVKGRRCKGI